MNFAHLISTKPCPLCGGTGLENEVHDTERGHSSSALASRIGLKVTTECIACEGKGRALVAFASGHLDLTEDEFAARYKPDLNKAIAMGRWIIVCDARGADTMVQEFLKENDYGLVKVFHMLEKPRVNLGSWETRGGYESDEQRDSACTEYSDYDIAWSRREGSGTAKNIERRQMIEFPF